MENNLVNFLKFLFAICVVWIHTGFFSDVNPKAYFILTYFINSMAVPFFFVVAGYFFKPEKEKVFSLSLSRGKIKESHPGRSRSYITFPLHVLYLLIPFFVWSTIAVLIGEGVHFSTFKSLLAGWVLPLSSPGAAMWFLKVLCICFYIIWVEKNDRLRKFYRFVMVYTVYIRCCY